MLRNLITQYADHKIPGIPEAIKCIGIPDIRMQQTSSIWQALTVSVHSPQPVPMEMLDQNQGLILYSTELVGHKGGKLTIWEPHDYALVFLNHKFIDTVFRDGGKWTIDLPKPDVVINNPVLEILVEGMGHINFAQFMIDRKGITDRVTLNGMTLMNWDIYPMPLDYEFMKNGLNRTAGLSDDKEGIFFTGKFNLSETGDTYFDMSRYSKGVVFINGHNLGRYWNIGPQQRLFCPAGWLKKGENEIIVLDLHQKEAAVISGKTTLE
jgi:beta-galactosidase